MIMRFVERQDRCIPDDLTARIREHVRARFDRNEQTVIDYGHYEGWNHSHYACDVNHPATRDPDLLAMLERVSDLYRADIVDFARAFEESADHEHLVHAPVLRPVPSVVHDVELVSAFVTRYLPGNERFDDHDDLCDVSLVVEISDADYEGGGVVGSDDTPWTRVRLDAPERGSAVVIGRRVSHKTIPMRSGIRWALVLFFYYV
jgi:hypothetical protein